MHDLIKITLINKLQKINFFKNNYIVNRNKYDVTMLII